MSSKSRINSSSNVISLIKDYYILLKVVISKQLYFPKCFPGGSVVKNLPANAGDTGSIPGWEDPLEKEMATHSSILTCRIPWTEEPGGLHGVTKSWT